MIKPDEKLRKLTAVLDSGKKESIIDVVRSLKKEEPPVGAIALLVAFYDASYDKVLQKTIESFFNDIKHKTVRKEIIAEIKKPWKSNTISMLISSCWQSGLDYSEYLADIATIYLKADYVTAIECMTVIEESAGRSDRKTKDDIIRIIMESSSAHTHEKSPLTSELIGILQK